MTAAGNYADTMDWPLAYMTNTVGLTSPPRPPLRPRSGYDSELGRTLSFHRRRREELRQLSFRKGSVSDAELARKRKRLAREGEDDDDTRDILVTDALKASLSLERRNPPTVDSMGNMDITIGQQLLEISKTAAVSLLSLPAMIASSAVSSLFEVARTKLWGLPARNEVPATAIVDDTARGDQRQIKRKKRRHAKKKSQTLDLASRTNALPHTQPAGKEVLHTVQQTPTTSPIAALDDPFVSTPFEPRADGGGVVVIAGKAGRADTQAKFRKHTMEDGTTGKPLDEVMRESMGRAEISFLQEERVLDQMRELEISPGATWISVQKYSKRFEARKKKKEHLKKLKEEQERKERERLEAEAAAKEREMAKARLLERLTPSEAVIRPLSSEWEVRVDELMRSGPNVPLARTSTGVELKLNSFRTLLPRPGELGWLDDEVINAYMQAVVDYGNGGSGARRLESPRYHAFNSFFYKKLNESGPATLARWSKRAKIEGDKLLQVELIFIPVHLGNHWTLLVVSGTKKSIEYFDSLNGSPARPLKNAKLWLQNELKDKWVEDEWKTQGTLGPCQRNGYDCGVFTVTTAKMLMLGINPLAYSQSDIHMQRRRMAAELHYGGFKDEFSPPWPPGGGGSWVNR
ncbi:MAG: Smt3-specific protease [Geoglossum simile]|nr:MAG: Smt3-specific protease [Geoglossum simile]